MDKNSIWSLRLGYTNQQAAQIEKLGIALFLKQSFDAKFDTALPSFLDYDPKTLADLKALRQSIKVNDSEQQKKIIQKQIRQGIELKSWWIDKIKNNPLPLLEKMVCFWHNHFVSTTQKVKVNYWVYQHNMLLRENAFGNFKELTKKIVKSNAMVRYLDNVDNKKGKINENLSRELLELFTLGIGNYTESDIQNGAKALAGLGLGENEAQYRRFFEDNGTITYLGKSGNFKADDLIDIIFEQPAIPYLITKKILNWFIYDSPPEALVKYYGDYFRKQNFEIQPLLVKIFTEEFPKNNAGSKIKDPLVYLLQLADELHISNISNELIAFFIKQQGMDLFNQPNVKGWDGGNSWLSSQIYLQRNNTSDLLCSGRNINRKIITANPNNEEINMPTFEKIKVKIDFDAKGDNKTIISQLANRLLFQVDTSLQKDMETILKYDFEPKSENANEAVLRLFNYITKTPEYQLI